MKPSGTPFLRIETADASLKHLQAKAVERPVEAKKSALVWTPRALKLAQEAGLVPDQLTDVEATGPGNRVSGDDIARYLERRKAAS